MREPSLESAKRSIRPGRCSDQPLWALRVHLLWCHSSLSPSL